MQGTFARIKKHFDDHEFHYLIDDEEQCLRSDFTGSNCIMKIAVSGDESRLQLSILPQIATPGHARSKIGALVLARNWVLPFGRFDYQMESGRLVFEYSVMHAGEVDDQLIGNMISYSFNVVDEFIPAHSMVCFAGANPKTALEKIEELNNLENELDEEYSSEDEDLEEGNTYDVSNLNEVNAGFEALMKRSFDSFKPYDPKKPKKPNRNQKQSEPPDSQPGLGF